MTEPAETRWSATSPGLARYIWMLWVIWLVFLWYPLGALFHAHPGPLHLTVVLAAATAFSAVYVWHIVRSLERLRVGRAMLSPWPALAVLAAIALGLTIGDRRDWIELFIFVTVSLGPALPPRRALIGVGLMVLLAPILGTAVGASAAQIAQMMFQPAISGIAVIIVVRTIVLDRELRLAREEITRLAVSEERLRFARDLHDLLGHSLSLIALKTELVGKLIPVSPERAVAENRDVEQAARAALQEVRAAVTGYRQPTLAEELQSARQILAAAGIDFHHEGEAVTVPAAQEAVLSWTVREGVTNVIKHSRARHCTIRLTRDSTSIQLEVIDDGLGGRSSSSSPQIHQPSGSGLPGLAERVAALHGRFEAGPGSGGGFRLAVSVPVSTRAGREIRDREPAREDRSAVGPA
jgi:two-component system sensor histidine kinase DesK